MDVVQKRGLILAYLVVLSILIILAEQKVLSSVEDTNRDWLVVFSVVLALSVDRAMSYYCKGQL